MTTNHETITDVFQEIILKERSSKRQELPGKKREREAKNIPLPNVQQMASNSQNSKMKREPIIFLLDIDGVLADYAEGFTRFYNTLMSTEYQAHDMKIAGFRNNFAVRMQSASVAAG